MSACPKCERGGTGPHPTSCTPERRFWRKVRFAANGCWEWTASLSGKGYGQIRLAKDRLVYAHIFAYERTIGDVPEGLELLHSCDNPRCVRVSHLRAGTHTENMRDMVAKGRCGARKKTHCKRGHAFTSENTARHKDGYQICRECGNAPRRKGLRPQQPYKARPRHAA